MSHLSSVSSRKRLQIRRESSQSLFNMDEDGNKMCLRYHFSEKYFQRLHLSHAATGASVLIEDKNLQTVNILEITEDINECSLTL